MKYGIICEGSHTDKPVLEKVLLHNFPNTQFSIVARDKKAVFYPCYEDINSLVTQQINNIIIIWDLLPVGHQMAVASQWSEKPSRGEQRKMLVEKLINSDQLMLPAKEAIKNLSYRYGFGDVNDMVSTPVSIQLICVCYALDGWLLSDEYVLRRLASTNAHPVNTLSPSPDRPDFCQNPAGQLTKIFKSAPNKRFRYFNKHTHNASIIQEYIDTGRLDKLRASHSYSRLIDTLAAWGAS